MRRANKEFRSDGLTVCNHVSFITELWLLVLFKAEHQVD